MLRTDEILNTVRMLASEHLDVRAVTMGIDLNECAGPDIGLVCQKIAHKITSRAARLVEVCEAVGGKYKIPVVNKRLAVSPISILLEGHREPAALQIARTLDECTAKIGVDLIGGFTALVERGQTPGQKVLMASLPTVLSQTRRVCSSVNVASSKAGINMNAVGMMGQIIKDAAEATISLLEEKKPYGLYHITNSGVVSFYDFIARVIEMMGVETNLVRAKDRDFGGLGHKPLKAALKSVKLKPLRSWQDALSEYIVTEVK